MGFEAPEPVRVPSPDAMRKRAKDNAIIEQIKNADATTVAKAFDHISNLIDEHPEIANDETIREKLTAILDRLEELGYNPTEEGDDTPETVH